MAVIGNSYLDLYEMHHRGQDTGLMIELLAQKNPVMLDALTQECNDGSKHKTKTRTGLPSAAWTALYEGVPQSKSTTQMVEDTTGRLESFSMVDARLLDGLASEEAMKQRLVEADAHFETMAQDFQSAFFYADTATEPKKFKGLAARFNQVYQAGRAPATKQVVDAGGTGSDNTSIWFVEWSDLGCQLLYPKGTKGGIHREDMGRQPQLDGNNNRYYGYEDSFKMDVGLAVRDYRRVSRVANIDVSALVADPNAIATDLGIYDVLRKAYYRLHNRRAKQPTFRPEMTEGNLTSGRLAIYMNTDVLEALDEADTQQSQRRFLKPMEVHGEEIMTYRGIPIRETDAILNTEARVV